MTFGQTSIIVIGHVVSVNGALGITIMNYEL